MLDNDPPEPTWSARPAHTAYAAVAGVALGLVDVLWGFFSPLTVAAVIAVSGALAAIVKLSLPLITVGVGSLLVTSAVVGQFSGSDSIVGFLIGIVYAFCFLVAALVVALVRARRSYLRRGWDLAFAEAREHEARLEQAVTREREAMAGEIHDGLGHRLTLIAVQASRLSLDDQLPEHARAQMLRIRENAAAAAEELGDTVRLLDERRSGLPASLSGMRVDDVIERARAAGVTVDSTVAPRGEEEINDYAHAALLRTLQEGLTNAAKHAPGAEVAVEIELDGDEVVLRMRNAAPPTRPRTAPTGHGLVAVRHRVAILGGALEVEFGETFTLTARFPRDATPSTTAAAEPESSRVGAITAQAADAERQSRRATRRAWMIPAAMILIATLVAVGYFVYANLASVLEPERFAAIEVGDDRVATERLLPPEEMLDAPRSLRPEPPGAECYYFEESVSFFRRANVFRICMDDDQVVSTDTIPPGY